MERNSFTQLLSNSCDHPKLEKLGIGEKQWKLRWKLKPDQYGWLQEWCGIVQNLQPIVQHLAVLRGTLLLVARSSGSTQPCQRELSVCDRALPCFLRPNYHSFCWWYQWCDTNPEHISKKTTDIVRVWKQARNLLIISKENKTLSLVASYTEIVAENSCSLNWCNKVRA